MKILFYFFRLHASAGGAERMLCTLASEMSDRGHRVEIVTWDCDYAEAFYPIPSDVRWHKLGFEPGLRDKVRRTLLLRRLIREVKPDVFVGFVMSADKSVYAANFGTGAALIAAERNAPSMYDYRMSRFRRWFYFNLFFRMCDRVTVQLEEYRKGYPPYLHPRIAVIPNPVRQGGEKAQLGGGDRGRHTMLAVGRLDRQKRFDVLITAFSALRDRFPEWDLRIVGEGPERSILSALVQQLNVGERVVLPGETEDVAAEYVKADLFVTSAEWEGFPNALAEALAHGLPAVGFEGCPGVSALILDGVNGLLAGGNADAESLAQTLERVLSDKTARSEMAQAAPGSVQRFCPQRVFDLWEALFMEVRDRRRPLEMLG